MTRSLNRRDFLKSTGGGVVGATLVSTQVSAISPSSDVLWADDFESYEPGDEPDGVVMAGNDDQEVVDEVSASGAQSYRLSGSHGGCWRAIARFPFDVESEMVFRGHFKVGSGSEGCHSGTGAIRLRTEASSSWSAGSGTGLLRFYPDETVELAGEEIDTYSPSSWTAFEVEYRRNDDGTVTQTARIDDGESHIITREEDDHEDDLSALELRSGDFTVYWDQVSVERGTLDNGDDSGPDPSIQAAAGDLTLGLGEEQYDSRAIVGSIEYAASTWFDRPLRFQSRVLDAGRLSHVETHDARTDSGDGYETYSIERSYESDEEHRVRLTHSISVYEGAPVALISTEVENESETAVEMNQPSSNIHRGWRVSRLPPIAEPQGTYRYAVSGQETRNFDDAALWETTTPAGDIPFVTHFDDEIAITTAQVDGETGPEMVITDEVEDDVDAADYAVEGLTLEPGESATYVTSLGIHEGGSNAPDRSETLAEVAADLEETGEGVDPGPEPDIAIAVDAPAEIDADESAQFEVSVTNEYDGTQAVTVELDLEGEVDERTDEIAGDDEALYEFVVDGADLEATEHDWTVLVESDEAAETESGTVTVRGDTDPEPEPALDLDVTVPAEVEYEESVTIEGSVTNESVESVDVTLEVSVDGMSVDDRIPVGTESTEPFDIPVDVDLEPGDYDWTVTASTDEAEDDENGTVTVLEPEAEPEPALELSTDVPGEIEVTEETTLSVSVTNEYVEETWVTVTVAFPDAEEVDEKERTEEIPAESTETMTVDLEPGTLEEGEYEWTVTAFTDDVEETETGTVTAIQTSFDPVIEIEPSSPQTVERITFDASETAGDPSAVEWTFGDGSGDSGEVVEHVYEDPGSYDASVTIVGEHGSTTEEITVELESSAIDDRAKSLREVASELDDETVLGYPFIDEADRTETHLEELFEGVANGEIEREHAERGLNRTLWGTRVVQRTNAALGPATYGGLTDYNLTRRINRTGVELLIKLLAIKKVLAKKVLAHFSDSDLILELFDRLSGAIDEAVSRGLGLFFSNDDEPEDEDTTGTSYDRALDQCEQETDLIEAEFDFEAGDVPGINEFVSMLDTAIDSVAEVLTTHRRTYFESIWYTAQLGYLRSRTDTSTLADDGPRGSDGDAEDQFASTFDSIDVIIETANDSMDAIDGDLADQGILESIVDAAGDPSLRTFASLLRSLADFVWDLIGVLRDLANMVIGMAASRLLKLRLTKGVEGITNGRYISFDDSEVA